MIAREAIPVGEPLPCVQRFAYAWGGMAGVWRHRGAGDRRAIEAVL